MHHNRSISRDPTAFGARRGNGSRRAVADPRPRRV